MSVEYTVYHATTGEEAYHPLTVDPGEQKLAILPSERPIMYAFLVGCNPEDTGGEIKIYGFENRGITPNPNTFSPDKVNMREKGEFVLSEGQGNQFPLGEHVLVVKHSTKASDVLDEIFYR